MSGIFKGESIYKNGGGGGGYKDGGELVDNDFIKVDNNTTYSYDNITRDPINFYFEPKDGEALNSIIELTTVINSTVNVYVFKFGFLYLIGNIGGNTVNAGEKYKINVSGDSFSVNPINVPENDPSAWEYEGIVYGMHKIGSLYWTDKPFIGNISEHVILNNVYYFKWDLNLKSLNINGFRLPKKEDYYYLFYSSGFSKDDLKSKTGWPTSGTNLSGINLKPNGLYNSITNEFSELGNSFYGMESSSNVDNSYSYTYLKNSGASGTGSTIGSYIYMPIILVKDV